MKCDKCGKEMSWHPSIRAYECHNCYEIKSNVVEHPDHYAYGRNYEPIDVIEDWNLGFNLGNVVKYISRAGRKDDVIVDLEKARWYLDREINRLKG